ncbi:molybdenum cofactor guanylyltransferase [Flexivirga oryzae]|uniref:Molybdopterin-guanine dinucleotide biosynthesis protein A n=1 Tax=Flexivirga oryzae TaxID=1794944 RepID=A0A839NA93_9MICO|nr:molybdenum cofactor guanylyltransferase [Flexivirga oryzae]MBB2894660.1 molybdopterin-guanine dinucleotide biosynthesis protein A [Flexivirga oryzae]
MSDGSADPAVVFDAIVLVGGAGSRLGGVDKAAVELAGRSLVSRPLEAVRDARTLVVVGDTAAPDIPDRAIRVVEDPPGSGPAAATVAGLRAIEEPAAWTYLISCDVPGAVGAIQLLAEADAGDSDGVVLAEPDGRLQWLLGRYRSFALYDAAEQLGDAADRSMRALLEDLDLVPVPAPEEVWRDVDTWDDHAHWTHTLGGDPRP